MSGSDTDIQWFIARDGKQHGPVSDVELNKLVELSHLKPTDLVWRQGFPDWRKASSVFPAVGGEPAQAKPSAPSAAATPPKGSAPASAPASGPGSGSGPSLGRPGAQQGSGPAPSGAGPQTQRPAEPRQPAPHTLPGANASDAARRPNPGPGPGPGPGPNLGDARPSHMGTRPLGNAPMGPGPSGQPANKQTSPAGGPGSLTPGPRMGGPAPGMGRGPGMGGPGPGPGPMASQTRDEAEPAPRRRKAPLIAAGLILMGGIGAWLGSQYTNEIFAVGQLATTEGTTETGTVTANLAPSEKKQPAEEPEAAPEPKGPTFQDIDRAMQRHAIWSTMKREFPEWYQSRVAEATRLAGENKSEAEITGHLIGEFVKLRRENAKHALAASTARHRDIASAFLANLRQLAQESGNGCYEFISRGEVSSVVVERLQSPARSKQIESQLIAVVAAITEGRKQPSEHTRPVKTDYDLLAGELGRLGWTQADMQLFANPKELAKAPPQRVCSMLQDWFAAHLAIQDQSTQQRLLFETLKPVVSG